MAEEEISKHAKKALKAFGNKKSSFLHKLIDFVLEIFIIVFAISLSIWFHNWSEHKKEQKIVKTFLLGLKEDIQADITDTKEILEVYQNFKVVYTYLGGLSKDKIPDKDSMKYAFSRVYLSPSLNAHQSRFNGFLSAGKILTIENDSLTQEILNYYQIMLPALLRQEGWWESRHNSLIIYFAENAKVYRDDWEEFKVVTTARGKYITNSIIPWPGIFYSHEIFIDAGNEIITEINKMYPDNK
jgi:hypothetical protein